MAFENISVGITDAVGVLTIHRPKQLNALNQATLVEILQAMREFSLDTAVRAVVVTGSGDKAFVAGADIKAMQGMAMAEAQNFAGLGQAAMIAIESGEKPVIAAVNGFALGGGFELALACDWIVASETAVFGLPEVSLGLFPGFGGTQRLLRVAGKAKAMDLISTGRKIDAATAEAWGIVNTVVPADDLLAHAIKQATLVARNAPTAVKMAKRVILHGAEVGLGAGLNYELATFPQCFATADSTEGIAAFLEKRRPEFPGN